MSRTQAPSTIDNTGLVKDPAKRRIIEQVTGVVGIVLGTILVVDSASPEFDVTVFTTPASAGFLYIVAALGFTTTLPNIPKN